ncbi:MAG: MBL fold metallo-hydrolase [Ardenticatenaceae bacterium]
MAEFAGMNSVTVGDIKVTFLADGGGIINAVAMFPASGDPAGWEAYSRLLDGEGNVHPTIGGFLIEVGDQKIAVDMGLGPMRLDFPGFGPFIGGDYMDSLEQTGIAREDVTDVVYTHLHLDHVGWTSIEVNGQRELMYPNARHMTSQTEWDFWHGQDHPVGPNIEAVQQPLAGIIEFISEGDEIAPGVTVVSTPGHTPGHISLFITVGDERLCLAADLLHSESQLYEPTWSVPFDNDPIEARATREAMYDELTQPNTLTALGHFSNQVFGHLSQDGDQYVWTPLES